MACPRAASGGEQARARARSARRIHRPAALTCGQPEPQAEDREQAKPDGRRQAAPTARRERDRLGQLIHVGLVPRRTVPEGSKLLARRGIEDLESPVAAANEQASTVGRQTDRADPVAEIELIHLLALSDVPEADGPIAPAANQRLAVGGEDNTLHIRSMAR